MYKYSDIMDKLDEAKIYMCMVGGEVRRKCEKCGKPTLIKYIDTDSVLTTCPFCDDIPTRS